MVCWLKLVEKAQDLIQMLDYRKPTRDSTRWPRLEKDILSHIPVMEREGKLKSMEEILSPDHVKLLEAHERRVESDLVVPTRFGGGLGLSR